jgi:Ion channel
MSTVDVQDQRHRVRMALSAVFARSFGWALVLLVLYYVLPLDTLDSLPLVVSLVLWILVFMVSSAVAILAVMRSKNPSLQAIESTIVIAVLLAIVFGACYYVMQVTDPTSFSEDPLTRTDTLYFAVTVLSTVGFGDIAPASQAARAVAMIQMVLDVVILGVGVKLLTQAVKFGRAHRATTPDSP